MWSGAHTYVTYSEILVYYASSYEYYMNIYECNKLYYKSFVLKSFELQVCVKPVLSCSPAFKKILKHYLLAGLNKKKILFPVISLTFRLLHSAPLWLSQYMWPDCSPVLLILTENSSCRTSICYLERVNWRCQLFEIKLWGMQDTEDGVKGLYGIEGNGRFLKTMNSECMKYIQTKGNYESCIASHGLMF